MVDCVNYEKQKTCDMYSLNTVARYIDLLQILI